MKSRNELAHDYFCALLQSDTDTQGPYPDVAMAFALADAFLAACGEQPAQEREPDAVWTLERWDIDGVMLLGRSGRTFFRGDCVELNDLRRTTGGRFRDRVKLAVRVVEDGQ